MPGLNSVGAGLGSGGGGLVMSLNFMANAGTCGFAL